MTGAICSGAASVDAALNPAGPGVSFMLVLVLKS